jgi:hypothetical protein
VITTVRTSVANGERSGMWIARLPP